MGCGGRVTSIMSASGSPVNFCAELCYTNLIIADWDSIRASSSAELHARRFGFSVPQQGSTASASTFASMQVASIEVMVSETSAPFSVLKN